MKKNIYSIYLFIISVFIIILAGCGGGGTSNAIGGYSVLSTGSLVLSWEAPTLNIDGSSLTDLSGYKVYYGQVSGNYTESVDIGNLASANISNLTAGTWCFVTTAYDVSGNESAYSNEICTEIVI